ncbi:galactokinase, partial [Muriicola sp.]|uniref:galactokinase n=1 Tax=Muriicola sp. TaxID=2020856 RepID=UPI003C78F983
MDQRRIGIVRNHFLEQFRTTPLMVFSPGRINLIGEHTDYNLGYALPAAVDMGIVMAVQQSKGTFCTAIAMDKDEKFSFDLNQMKPLYNGWINYLLGVVDEIRKKGKIIPPFDVVFGGDLPPGAGLSSSAALENALVFSLNELFRLGLSKMEMIHISQAAEHNFVGVQCGIMDQFASMFGQKDHGLFLDCNTLEFELIPFQANEYQLLLLNTNVPHQLADTAYNDRREVCNKAAKLLGVGSLRELSLQELEVQRDQFARDDYQKILFVLEENSRVISAVAALRKNDLRTFGEILYASHAGLQFQYKVSCTELDFLVDLAKVSEDVLGARMMGGGFGGCT